MYVYQATIVYIHAADVHSRADTTEERGKFIADANRLAMDISGNQTFNTVKPLLNFWAAFVPSNEVMTISCTAGH